MRMVAFVDQHGVGRWAVNFILILLVFGALVVWGQHAAAKDRETRFDFCVKLEQVRSYARGAAERGLKTVPTLAYYRQHPREKKQALREIQRQIDYFSPPLDCKQFARELTN